MSYSKTGPFTNGSAPGVDADFLNEVERSLEDDHAPVDHDHQGDDLDLGDVTATQIYVYLDGLSNGAIAPGDFTVYPRGFSYGIVGGGSAAGWPGYGVVYTVKNGSTRTFQLHVGHTTPNFAFRSYYSTAGGWTEWQRMDAGVHVQSSAPTNKRTGDLWFW